MDNSVNNIVTILQEELGTLADRLRRNRVSINTNKSKVMLFSSKLLDRKVNYINIGIINRTRWKLIMRLYICNVV